MTTTIHETIAETLRVPMRDGVELSVHIYRPATDAPVPAVMGYTPYRKGRLGSTTALAERGYAEVIFDIRGTGDSGGWNDSVYCDAERQDGYDMVEWIAAQPWCTGDVGMYGISYGAVVSLQIAAAAPPHLKAIIARSGTDDPYTEWTNPGGQPRPYIYENYSTIMTAFNFSPPDPEVVGDRWAALWEERLQHNVPWGIAFLEHLQDGPFWRVRSMRGHYDQVRCAVYVVDGWADWYVTPLLRIFSELTGPKRALIGPWSHLYPDQALPGPRIDWQGEMGRWFDHWLKGIDTGIMDEPPVNLFVREFSQPATLLMEDQGAFKAEREWPIARRNETPFYLRAAGRLADSPGDDMERADEVRLDPRVGSTTGMHGGGPFNINWVMPLDQRPDEIDSLVYTSSPLAEPLEVTGTPRVTLHCSSTAETALLAVKLCDVAPDGTSALVTKGFLNLTHRDSHTDPAPLEPDTVCEISFDLLTCAYRFAAGHRLRVVIAAADYLNVWPTPIPCVNTIYHCTALPSHITLPVIPPASPGLPAPDLGSSPHPLPRRETLHAPYVTITRDLIGNMQTLEYRTQYGRTNEHTARYTVSADDPAHAVVQADAHFRFDYPGRDIVVDALCTTTSDAAAFHHTVEVNITVNDRPHFSKNWARSVPRRGM